MAPSVACLFACFFACQNRGSIGCSPVIPPAPLWIVVLGGGRVVVSLPLATWGFGLFGDSLLDPLDPLPRVPWTPLTFTFAFTLTFTLTFAFGHRDTWPFRRHSGVFYSCNLRALLQVDSEWFPLRPKWTFSGFSKAMLQQTQEHQKNETSPNNPLEASLGPPEDSLGLPGASLGLPGASWGLPGHPRFSKIFQWI